MDRKVDYLKNHPDSTPDANSLNIPVYRKPDDSASSDDSVLSDVPFLSQDLDLDPSKIKLTSNSLSIPAKKEQPSPSAAEKKAPASIPVPSEVKLPAPPAIPVPEKAEMPAAESSTPASISMPVPPHAIPVPKPAPEQKSPEKAPAAPSAPSAAPQEKKPLPPESSIPAAPIAAEKTAPAKSAAEGSAAPAAKGAMHFPDLSFGKGKAKKSAKDRMSYAERMAVGKKFYINLLKVFLVTCLICGVGLGYLWFWLSRYESQSVNGAVHSYLTNIVNKNWDAVYQEDTDNFVELNSKDKYVSYLESLYGDNAISAYTYSFTNADENSQYYTLYAYGYQIATLELRKPKSSSTWKVRTLNTSNSYVFDVLDSSISFLINNIVIDSTYTHEDSQIPYAFQNLGLDDQMPAVSRYTIQNFVDTPDVTLADSASYEAIRDWTSNQYYIGPLPSSDETDEFTQEITDTAEAYCKYITKDGTFAALNKHLYPGTDFYNNITGFNNQWFSSHDSIEFQNVKVFDIMPIGDSAFIGSISFDYLVSASDVQKTYSSSYQLFFVKNSKDLWKMTNLAIISSTDTANTDGASATATPAS